MNVSRGAWLRTLRLLLALTVVASVVLAAGTRVPRVVTPTSLTPDAGGVLVMVSDAAVTFDIAYTVSGMAPDGTRERRAPMLAAQMLVRFWAPRPRHRGFDALVALAGRARLADPLRQAGNVLRRPGPPAAGVRDRLRFRDGAFDAWSCLGSASADGSRADECRLGRKPRGGSTSPTQRFEGAPHLAPENVDRRGTLWSAGTIAITGPLEAALGTVGSYESQVALPRVGAAPADTDHPLPTVTTDGDRVWYVPAGAGIDVTVHAAIDEARYEMGAAHPALVEDGALHWAGRDSIGPAYRVVDKEARARVTGAVSRAESTRHDLRWTLLPTAASALVGLQAGVLLAPATPSPRRGRRRRKRRERR